MYNNLLRFLPVLLPLAAIIFIFFADEAIWKKLILSMILALSIIVNLVFKNMSVKLITYFIDLVIFIILIYYFRNRQVL